MAHERIAIADDEAASRHHCRTILEGAGYHLLEAADGDQLLTLAEAHRPQLILVDLLMPGMDGFELVTELRLRASTAMIPILYLSTLAAEEAASQGVAAFLSKPFEREALVGAMRRCVRPVPPDRPRILVVDDELDIVDIVCDYLSDAGYQGLGAYDGQEAIRAVERQAPAGIVLDVKMPVLDGYGVIRWVKRHPVHRRIPIIILTATKVQRVLERTPAQLPQPFRTIPKPCEAARLIAAVQQVLHGA